MLLKSVSQKSKSQNVSNYKIHTCILLISTFYANALGKWGSLFTKMHPLVVATSHSSSISEPMQPAACMQFVVYLVKYTYSVYVYCSVCRKYRLSIKVMRVTETICDPFIQNILQNQQSSPLMSIIEYFAQLCRLVKICK